MAEAPVIECPATPERIDQCPDTPDRLLCVKSPESSSTASSCDDNDFCFLGRSRTGSPPPNCAICLGKCKSKCFTDSCLHQFCFKCLLEWSKIKAECPLCKQAFKSIIHNVKSIDQFEEYYVPPPQPQSIPVPRPIPSHSTLFNPRFVHEMASRTALHQYSHLQRFDVFLSEMPRSLTSTMRQQLRMICYMPGGNIGQMWRKFVYEKKLYALPVVDITGRFRECSARFYRDNPAQMHRLLPWLNRDLVCLLQNSAEHQVGFVLSTLTELLTIYNITSPEFRRRCQPYLRRRTSHFIHEFVNFARSPYDMIGYDIEVRYAPYVEPQTDTSGISDDTEESRILRANLAGFTFSSRSEFTRFMLSRSTFDEDFAFGAFNPAPDINFTDLPAIDLIESNDESSLGDVPQSRRIGHSEIENVVVSSSSSDECEFVREEKPPHLRTPDMVSLHSESDSDVVFVSECVSKKESNTPEPRKLDKSQKRKIQKIMSTIFSLSSSSSSCSNESDLEKEFKGRKKLKVEHSEKPKKEKCDDPNKGASTSSGVTNATTKRTLRKKYYARPVRQARSKHKKNVKSIYEESSDSYSNCTSSETTDISTDTESDSSESESNSDTSSDRSTSKNRRKLNRKTKRSKHRRSDSSIKKKNSKKFRRKTQRKKTKKTKRQRPKRCIYSSSSPSPSPARKSPETVPDDF